MCSRFVSFMMARKGVGVNRFIKVLDGAVFPLAPDVKAALRHQSTRGKPFWGLTVDVKGAHRLVAIRRRDWPLIACQIREGGDVYINKVGTFGVSSASYWWGRLAAAIQRAGLKIVSAAWALWAMLFADDCDLTGEGSTYKEAMLCFIWWLVVLGVPLSWKKSKGGFTYSWIGYEKSVREWPLGVSASRAEWAIKWMDGVIQEGKGGDR